MQQWEYSSLMNDGPAGRDDLNKLGDDGWELVSVVAGQNSPRILYVFKRPRVATTVPPSQAIAGDL